MGLEGPPPVPHPQATPAPHGDQRGGEVDLPAPGAGHAYQVAAVISVTGLQLAQQICRKPARFAAAVIQQVQCPGPVRRVRRAAPQRRTGPGLP